MHWIRWALTTSSANSDNLVHVGICSKFLDMLTMVSDHISMHLSFPCDKMMIIKFYHDGLHSKMP